MKPTPDNFISVPFTIKNLDLYGIRNAILHSLNKALPFFGGRLLDVGCGKMPYKKYILKNSSINKYIGLDIESAIAYDTNIRPDFTWDGINMPFEAQSFDCAMATEVLEHCPEPSLVLDEIYRVLKPGGVFFFTVPFIWNLHEVPHDEYRYTPFALKRLLVKSGFSNIDLRALGGWDASLAQMIGLWSRRRPCRSGLRKVISILSFFIVKFLYKNDVPPTNFREGTMITGIWGIVVK